MAENGGLGEAMVLGFVVEMQRRLGKKSVSTELSWRVGMSYRLAVSS